MEKNNVNKIEVFALTSLGIFCQISPLFSRLAILGIFLILIFLLILNLKKNNYKIKIGTSLKWYSLLFLFVLISLSYTVNNINPDYVLIRMGSVEILIFLINQFYVNQDSTNYFFNGIIIGGILGMICVFYNQFNIIGIERLGKGLYGSSVEFGNVIITTLYVLIIKLSKNALRLNKILYVLFIVICLFAAMLSGGRKAILMPIIFWVILEAIDKKTSGIKKILKLLALCILICFIIYIVLNNSFLYSIIGYRIHDLVDAFLSNNTKEDASYNERMIFKQLAKKMFIEKPIFGYGVHGYAYMNLHETGNLVYSHDNFLEMLSCYGLIGFMLYYWIFIKLFKNIISMRIKIKEYPLISFFISFIILTIIMDLYTISFICQNTILLIVVAVEYFDYIRKEENKC